MPFMSRPARSRRSGSSLNIAARTSASTVSPSMPNSFSACSLTANVSETEIGDPPLYPLRLGRGDWL